MQITPSFLAMVIIVMTAMFATGPTNAQAMQVCNESGCGNMLLNNPTPAPLGGITLGQFNQHGSAGGVTLGQFNLHGGAGGNGGLLGNLGGHIQVNRLNLLSNFGL